MPFLSFSRLNRRDHFISSLVELKYFIIVLLLVAHGGKGHGVLLGCLIMETATFFPGLVLSVFWSIPNNSFLG